MKKILTTLVVLLSLSALTFSQNLLFKSGFEDTVELSAPFANGGQWYQYFTGADLSTGHVWPDDLPVLTPLDAYWTFKVPDTTALSNYAEVKIDTTVSHSGTKSLYMQVSDYNSGNFGNSMAGHVRCEYRLNLDTTLKQAYISYWMKVQPDFYTIMSYGTNRWRIMMEWFETGQPSSDYRWGLKPRVGTFASDSTSAFWQFYQDYQIGAGAGAFFINDTSYNQQGLVPVDQWFKVELYWKQAPDSTGRIWAAINGNTIFDEYGRNMNDTTPSALSNWQIFKLYVDEPSMDDGLVFQWIDDVEIWDTIPDQVTGIPEPGKDDMFKIKVYPNPAKSAFRVEWENSKEPIHVALYNSLGQEMFEELNVTSNPLHIPADQLESGIYLLYVRNSRNELMEVQKIVVE